jgi:peptide/nickel transport system substrate-binding protein
LYCKKIEERKEIMKKLTLSVLLLIALLALPIAAYRVQATGFVPGVMNGDRIGEPQDIDPAWAYDTSSAELLMNVYDPLLWFNRTNMNTYIPRLATSWYFTTIDEDSPLGIHWVTRLTFVIRTGVHFQTDGVNDIPGEGALMTPADVEYTFERILITDAATGPAWMVWEPLFSPDGAGGLDAILTDLGWPVNATTGWNTKFDEAIDQGIESDATTVWFNLYMPYEPVLQILAQNWGSIMNQAWCVWHGDWPGPSAGDNWYLWHDPATSPLYISDPSDTAPNLDAALGTGPYMLYKWLKGAGNSWTIVKNPNYWEGWSVTSHAGWGPGELPLGGHVDTYISNYIPEWSTRRLRFLGGLSDFCDVPRSYMGQVLGQPGIDCVYPLPQLTCDGVFFNFLVSSVSTHLGVMQPNSTFNQYGAPPNIMSDQDFRRAITHMFDYTTFLFSAVLNEGISPVTPIVPGLAYYDPNVGQAEEPVLAKLKKYGITGEPAGQLAYDLALAKAYLLTAWGGQLWANGFTMDAVYNEGNVARQIAATLMKDAFDTMNALYGTKFTIHVQSIPWNAYRTEQRSRVMPYFLVGWLADYPDAHNFVHPFMHSKGAFSMWQGYKGITAFPNQEVDDLINAGIATLVPSERQGNYTALEHKYVDFAPGFVTVQATGRHWERDWVEGWYYNPIYPGNYVYDLWKALAVTPESVDVEVTALECPTEIHITDITVNDTIIIVPSPISVTVTRLDTTGPASIVVIIGVGLQDQGGRDIVLDTDTATLDNSGSQSYTAYFASFIQDPGAPILAGTYRFFATVLVQSGFAIDTNSANDRIDQAPININPGDCNLDGTCDMADISICIDAFMSTPFLPNWDATCDTNRDKSVDMADISTCIDYFMVSYPFP